MLNFEHLAIRIILTFINIWLVIEMWHSVKFWLSDLQWQKHWLKTELNVTLIMNNFDSIVSNIFTHHWNQNIIQCLSSIKSLQVTQLQWGPIFRPLDTSLWYGRWWSLIIRGLTRVTSSLIYPSCWHYFYHCNRKTSESLSFQVSFIRRSENNC